MGILRFRRWGKDFTDGLRLTIDRDDDDGGNVPDDDDENPLAAFAELCVNILSSSLGSGIGKGTSRGSAATIRRNDKGGEDVSTERYQGPAENLSAIANAILAG